MGHPGEVTGGARLKPLDRWLRRRRSERVRPYVPANSSLLDIGCGDGALIRSLRGHVAYAVGMEPTLAQPVIGPGFELRPGRFPDDLPVGMTFDVITMLAVVEHLPLRQQELLADEFSRLLRPGGRVIITVPSARVDDILHVLLRLRLIAGIATHEHYGFEPANTPGLFPPPTYRLVRHARFQLGLNNLFVFERG